MYFIDISQQDQGTIYYGAFETNPTLDIVRTCLQALKSGEVTCISKWAYSNSDKYNDALLILLICGIPLVGDTLKASYLEIDLGTITLKKDS